MMNNMSLAIKFLWREVRHGEWSIVFLALLLSIAAVTTLHFYVDRLARGLDQQNKALLGGDLVLVSAQSIPAKWIQQAEALKIRHAQVWTYPTVASANGKMQLVNVQAVSARYPLFSHPAIPVARTAWIDNRLLSILNIKMNDSIRIGSSDLVIAKMLTADSDMLNTGWTIAPYVMLNLSDIPATKTVLPGSRVDYRLLLAGSESQIKQFKTWVMPQLTPGQRFINSRNQPTALRDILLRADQYLQLILLICLTMSGVVIALSVQQYLHKHYQVVALWRSLGARQKQIVHIFLFQLALIALLAGLLGVGFGFVAQTLLVNLFSDFLHFALPSSGWQPVWLGFSISLLLLFAFAYPVITQLPKTSPLYIWRQEIVVNGRYQVAYFAFAIVSLLIILMLSMGVSTLALFFMHGLLLTIVILYLLSHAILKGLRWGLNRTTGVIRRGISQLVQYPNVTSMQIIGFTLIIMSILVLQLVKHDLLMNWQKTLPSNTPNFFAFNIGPNDLEGLKKQFNSQHVKFDAIYPMIRARLTELNGKPIMEAVPPEAKQHNALHRELNISWMWDYPSDNKITSGHAWVKADEGQALISIEQTLASNLHVKLGDELTFQMADKKLIGKVFNTRSLQWTSFHPNFFVIFPPGFIVSDAVTYITSFYLPITKRDFISHLQSVFPNITILDVASLLEQIQTIVTKLSQALQYLFLFALGLAALIFAASLRATMDERKETYRLLRILGASKRYIVKSIAVEFLCLGLVIALMSIVLSYGMTTVLLKYVFSMI